MSKAVDKEKTWQQTKSENTRTTILDAAIQCFYDVGYSNTTTEKIAREAGVSRGAMLHHFPSRLDLIKSTVSHLHNKRLKLFEEQERQSQVDAEHSLIEEGIDAYWSQLHSPLFIVWHELHIASRTDEELRKIMRPALREYEANWYKVAANVFPDLAVSEKFETANLLTIYLLEGMAVHGISRTSLADKMVLWLKGQLREMFKDVNTVSRRNVKRR